MYEPALSYGRGALFAFLILTLLIVANRVIDTAALVDSRIADVVVPIGRVILGIRGLMRLLAIVAFLSWIHRAAANSFALGKSLSMSPAMCVFVFFIPFANLFLIHKVVSEIAAAAEITENRGVSVTSWWATYVISSTLSWIGSVLRLGGNDDAHFVGFVLEWLAAIILCGSLYIVYRIVVSVSEGQDRVAAAS